MTKCFFVSDLHGRTARYNTLFRLIADEKPDIVFIGGDIYPNAYMSKVDSLVHGNDFLADFFIAGLKKLKSELGNDYPEIFLILGNDDARDEEESIIEADKEGWFHYINCKTISCNGHTLTGYAYVPPTPFRLKDWEKYDVSRYIDPGCVSPEEGFRTVPVDESTIRFGTIKEDLDELAEGIDFTKSIFLFHSPPHDTLLDRAALDGIKIDHVPLDPHVGSIAIRRFIEKYQPMLTLHGHIHESTRITGLWKEKIGNTICLNAAHDGKELSVIRFNLEEPEEACRYLVVSS
jgi:Icc-related predicted phosphoesterase